MSYDNDPNALASALPGGISYDPQVTFDSDRWNARRIAEFQAERLAESGYQLVYVGESSALRQAVQDLAAEVDL